jgi:hypothetical protein
MTTQPSPGRQTPTDTTALEKRRAVETFFSTTGKAVLVFLAGGILVLLSLFGRQLLDLWMSR